MSAVVGTMSRADLERGMELARLSGEMQAAGRIVQRMQMRVLASYLADRAEVLGRYGSKHDRSERGDARAGGRAGSHRG